MAWPLLIPLLAMNRKRIFGLLFTALFTAAGAHAQAAGESEVHESFGRYDADGDGYVTQVEARAEIGPVFKYWDYDASEDLVDLELLRGIFSAWDTDGDDDVDKLEFTNGKTVWLPEELDLMFETLDEDGNLRVTFFEFAHGLHDVEYGWNEDPKTTSVELASALIENFDENEDGRLSKKEWPLQGMDAG